MQQRDGSFVIRASLLINLGSGVSRWLILNLLPKDLEVKKIILIFATDIFVKRIILRLWEQETICHQ